MMAHARMAERTASFAGLFMAKPSLKIGQQIGQDFLFLQNNAYQSMV
jgi:hypothetical protein